LAAALFAAAAPFILQVWVGLGAVAVFYVIERARVFVTEIIRTAETPFYQAIAQSSPYTVADKYATLLCALGLAAVFPALTCWGPRLEVIEMLDRLWPFLSLYCLAAAASTRSLTVFAEGRQQFLTSSVLRVTGVLLALAVLLALSFRGNEDAYAIAILPGEVVVATLALMLGYKRQRLQ
jgi:hypothetical protein